MTGPQSATLNVMLGDVFLYSGQSNMERYPGINVSQSDIFELPGQSCHRDEFQHPPFSRATEQHRSAAGHHQRRQLGCLQFHQRRGFHGDWLLPGEYLTQATELAAVMKDLCANEWSHYTHHFKPTFKLLKREQKNGKTKRVYEPAPQTPYQRWLASPDIPEAKKMKLRAERVMPPDNVEPT